MIVRGDCIEVMAGMEPESIDAIVTDPPYGLEFMGKAWDHGAIGRPFADAMFRVAKPSAYLLAFGGTRTVHRMTCALEDTGWIIRDMLVWAYASGFPKSKASLKPAWEPIVMARKPGPLRMLAIDECRVPTTDELGVQPASRAPNRILGKLDYNADETWEQNPSGRWPANVILTDPVFDGGWEGVMGGGEASPGTAAGVRGSSGFASGYDGEYTIPYGDSGTYSRFFLVPKSSRSDREPVLDEYAYRLHRERGECGKLSAWASSTSPARATSEEDRTDAKFSGTSPSGSQSTDPSLMDTRSTTSTVTSRTTGSRTSSSLTPRPTSASIPVASSEMESGGSLAESVESSSLWEPPTGISVAKGGRSMDDADPATSSQWSSRNVCVKCGRPLPRVATHPTQKPTDLMRHLVRLVTPTGGTVLDPFLGSGTTGLAAEMEGFAWVGIEREAEYVAIAEARLNGTQRGLGLG